MSWTYSEQNIVQEPAAKMMEAVGWTSVLAYDAETFGPNGTLGRSDKSETVLWRSVRAALKRINGDWITDAQVEEAIEKLRTVEHGKSLMQLNSEAYEFVRDGVKVTDEEFGEDNEAYRTGTNAVRCVYANNGAVVRGFTLTGGRGVGVGLKNDLHDNMMGSAFFSASPLGATIENCVVSNNAAAVGTIYNAVVRRCRVIGNFGVLNDASGAAGYGCNWYGSIVDGNYGNGTMCFPEVVEGCTIGLRNRNLADSDASQVLVWNTDEDKAIVNTAVLGGKYYFGKTGKLYCTNCYVVAGDKGINRIIKEEDYVLQLHSTIVGKSGAFAEVDVDCRPILGAVSLIDNGDAAYATENVGDADVLGNQRISNGKMDIGAVEYDWCPTFSSELGKRFDITRVSPSVTTNASGGIAVMDGFVFGTVRSEGPYRVEIVMADGSAEVYVGDVLAGECSGAGNHSIRFRVSDPADEIRIVFTPDEENPAPAVIKAVANARGFILGIR